MVIECHGCPCLAMPLFFQHVLKVTLLGIAILVGGYLLQELNYFILCFPGLKGCLSETECYSYRFDFVGELVFFLSTL